MPAFVNPNIAYLLLILGFIFVFLALVTPGTHIQEAGALLFLFLAGYEVFYLGFNYWGLIVLVLSLVPLIYAIRGPKQSWALALAIVMLIAGSLYLFPGKGLVPEVHPVLAVIVSVLTAGFLWIAIGKGLQAVRARPLQDLERLIGQVGQARTEIADQGSVQLASELWSARTSNGPIQVGSKVRVVRREGFTLVVEPQDQSK